MTVRRRTPITSARAAYACIAALALTASNATAEGYGRYAWGDSRSSVRAEAGALRPHRNAEAVRLERRLVAALRKVSKRADREMGRRHTPDRGLRPRIGGFWHRVRLGRLPARVELLFFDDRLFGADVALLYRRSDRREVALVIHTLVEKYGESESTRGGGSRDAARVSRFDTGDGTLEVYQVPATARSKGTLALRYRGGEAHRRARAWVEGLANRLDAAEAEIARNQQTERAKRDRARRDALLQHL